MTKKLAILIAKSGVALHNIIPQDWEIVIADYSRLDQRDIQWWNYPALKSYDEIIIFDRNITTALTQYKLEREINALGVAGLIKYAGNPETLLAYKHQHYLLKKEGILPKPLTMDLSEGNISQFMIVIVGLPASGKTILRSLFSRLPGFSVYKWGKFLQSAVEKRYGQIEFHNGWDKVLRFTEEVEQNDRVAVAKEFLETSGVHEDKATFVVVDGIKSREQIIYVSYALQRPVIVLTVKRDEAERQRQCLIRGDFDDLKDVERLGVLSKMGAIDVMDFADFVVNTTGCATIYNENKTAKLYFTEQLFVDLHRILSWIFVSDSLEATKEMLSNAAKEVSKDRGYTSEVEVIP